MRAVRRCASHRGADGEWTVIEDENEEEYEFVITEENAGLEYRVVLVTEA